MSKRPSTAGYQENADALARQYESLAFDYVLSRALPLFPPPPARVLDVGAGTGRDAAGLAGRGYQVVAVEPTPALRAHGQRLHADVPLEWIDDTLPDLPRMRAGIRRFDVVMAIAVWMHLDAEERKRAMAAVAGLLAPGALVVLSLRHGPVPEGRRMFEVTGAETRDLAVQHGLDAVHESEARDAQRRADVTWTWLAFRRPV